jgi:hypothetical protein
MPRRALRIVRAVTLFASAVLLLLACVAWVDVAINSKDREFEVQWGGADRQRFDIYVGYSCGPPVTVLEWGFIDRDPPYVDQRWRWAPRDTWPVLDYLDPHMVWSLELGRDTFLSFSPTTVTSHRFIQGTMPLWASALLLSLWPIVAGLLFLRRHRRLNHRRKLGLCLDCGYDLRGLESPRCPECGATFSACDAVRGRP